MKPILLLFYISYFTHSVFSQCVNILNIEERFDVADVVVEVTILSRTSFIGQDGLIYTEHLADVHRQFSGSPTGDQIEIVTLGGTVGDELLVVDPEVVLIDGQMGIIFLNEYTGNRIYPPGQTALRPNTGLLSMMGYSPDLTECNDPFGEPLSLDAISEILAELSGQDPIVYDSLSSPMFNEQNRMMMPVITSFSPQSQAAGIGATITIVGTGFGQSPGAVFFSRPGGSFVAADDENILSCSASQITVQVPDQAGTGSLLIRTAANQQSAPTQNILQVPYSINSLIAGGEFQNPYLIDDELNGDGGYRLLLSTNDNNNGRSIGPSTPAGESFIRALRTWQEQANYSVFAGQDCGTTDIQVPERDGQNVIGFGNDNYNFDQELGNATVGIAFSYYSLCNPQVTELVEMDIFFRNRNVNWNFGPGPAGFGQTDFESVAAHELGHTIQLQHNGNQGSLMFPSINQGAEIREPSNGSLDGSDFVTDRSLIVNLPSCLGNPQLRQYQAYNPNLDCNPAIAAPVNYISFSGYPLTNSNKLDWQTAIERNSDYFEVQRSADGRNFESLGRVIAAGSSNDVQAYSFTDSAPLIGDNYYRLEQFDFDGSSELSELIVVFREDETSAGSHIFPNPVGDELLVDSDITGLWRLIGADGRLLQDAVMGSGGTRLTFDVSKIPAGIYVLQDPEGSSHRIMKK